MELARKVNNIDKGPLLYTIELLENDIVQVRIDFYRNRDAKPGNPSMSDHPLVQSLVQPIGLFWHLNQGDDKETVAFVVESLREYAKEDLPAQGLSVKILCLDDEDPTKEYRTTVRGLSDDDIHVSEGYTSVFCGKESSLVAFGILDET